jgi:single-stranded-DNA-specific exonuclease
MAKRWQEPDKSIPDAVREELKDYSPAFAQILFNRDIKTAEQAERFLNMKELPSTDPFIMKGMREGVDRILEAIHRNERIIIYGDYDVDGVTATVLMVEVLQAMGAKVDQYIPNRYEEGYGLNIEALSRLKDEGAALVITVDCGIRSNMEADHARKIGLDMIITDHHHPLGDLPRALAVICPKQAGDTYPDKDLAGVGLAFKLAQALTAGGGFPNVDLKKSLDLVALGTVADLAPLSGENRGLVKEGISQIKTGSRQGLVSLAGVAEIPLAKTTAADIGFTFGPRLNAAGRLETAQAAYNLLITRDISQTGLMAQQLNQQNYQRQIETRELQAQAAQLAVKTEKIPNILFAIDENYKSGLVGLAASRLVDNYYRPAVVGQKEAETTRCSCRSIPEFHITDALDQCADLLIRHGGHAAAAGFTVSNDKLDELISRLIRIADEQLGGRDLRPTLVADANVDLADLDTALYQNLLKLQPTGYGNREPLFLARKVKVISKRQVGTGNLHLKMMISSQRGVVMDAIGFRLGGWFDRMPEWVDLIGTFERNDYNGRSTFQMNVKDIRESKGD